MKILLTGTSFPSSIGDWKGQFVRHLVDALARRSDVDLSTWLPPGPLPSGVARASSTSDDAWLGTLMRHGGIAHLLRSQPLRGIFSGIALTRRLHNAYRHSNADLFHVNWLQNALSLPSDERPALVTALGTDLQLLRLPGMRTLLRRAFRQRRVAICPNADWMVPVLEQAFGDIAIIRTIPFGIDPGWYALERKFEASPTPKWLCVSRLTKDKLGPLFEWTEAFFSNSGAELHLFGPMQEQLKLPPWVHWHGPASPDGLREDWFPQAHGLVTLSRHAEGRPQVMLEAMASGLPIIASRLPAHDDLLAGGGGILCESPRETVEAMQALADPRANRAHGERARARMRTDVGTWDDSAQRYATLYRELVGAAET